MKRRTVQIEITRLECEELLASIDYRVREADRRRDPLLSGEVRRKGKFRLLLDLRDELATALEELR